MRYLPEKENTKLSALKEFLTYHHDGIIVISVTVIFVVSMTLTILLPLHFAPIYSTKGTVTSIGYKGITVEYKGAYGQDMKKEIDVDDVTGYQIGDTVTIEIKALNVKIVEERDSIDY